MRRGRAFDATPHSPFEKSRSIELSYARKLRGVAGEIGRLIAAFQSPVERPEEAHHISAALNRYSALLGPWSERVAARMIAEVDRQDETAWNKHARTLRRGLRQEIANAPTGHVFQAMMAENVGLIKSLPTEAAERVHKLTTEAMTNGTRAAQIAAEIARSGQVTKSRANLIARTEVARTGSLFTQARCLHVGANQFVWETMRDGDVRESHRQMQGVVCDWNDPPTLSDGTTTLPGQVYNCRCFARPLIDD